MEIQNVIEEIEELKQNMQMMHDLLIQIYKNMECDKAIGTKKEAAKFINYDEQTITSLIEEGRIINYGRGRIFIFHKSELLDVREVRIEKD